MDSMRLDIAGEKQYGVALKLTPELKQALLSAQQSGQAMTMTFGTDSASNVCFPAFCQVHCGGHTAAALMTLDAGDPNR